MPFILLDETSKAATMTATATTIHEIKSRNLGAGPLCQSGAPIAAASNSSASARHKHLLLGASPPLAGPQLHLLAAQRANQAKAVSMERLNVAAAKLQPAKFMTSKPSGASKTSGSRNDKNSSKNNNNNNSGSLSSASSSSSLVDELANDSAANESSDGDAREQSAEESGDQVGPREEEEDQGEEQENEAHRRQMDTLRPLKRWHAGVGPQQQQQQQQRACLSRSASRVSRFRSAKEFFERLSSGPQTSGSGQCLLARARLHQQQQQQQLGVAPISASVHNLHASPTQPLQRPSIGSSAHLVRLASSQLNLTSSSGGGGIATAGLASSTTCAILNELASTPRNHVAARYTGPLEARKQLSNKQQQQQQTPAKPQISLAGQKSRPNVGEHRAGETSESGSDMDHCRLAPTGKPEQQQVATSQLAVERVAQTTGSRQPVDCVPKSSSMVRLKSLDHSSLSSNTILHINNSHLRAGQQDGSPMQPGGGQQALPALGFSGDNVIVKQGSLLVRKNKQLRITFDEHQLATCFEYPSEESLMWPGEQEPAEEGEEEEEAEGELQEENESMESSESIAGGRLAFAPAKQQPTVASPFELNGAALEPEQQAHQQLQATQQTALKSK